MGCIIWPYPPPQRFEGFFVGSPQRELQTNCPLKRVRPVGLATF
jgi:hypothetical protein